MFYRPQTHCLVVGKELSSLDKALYSWQQCSMGGFSASCGPSYMVHGQNQDIKLLNLSGILIQGARFHGACSLSWLLGY